MKRRTQALHRTTELLNTLDKYGFSKDLAMDSTINIARWFDEHDDYLPENIVFACGATRVVVWDEDYCDYVLKIAIRPYCNMYNETEYVVYQDAKSQGVEQYFAWIDLMCVRNGVSIYAMEFCDVNDCELSDESYCYQYEKYCEHWGMEDTEEVREEFNDSMCDDVGDHGYMMEYAEHIWGSEIFAKIDIILWTFGVNDCHSGNWGYAKRGLVLTDYAGYHG